MTIENNEGAGGASLSDAGLCGAITVCQAGSDGDCYHKSCPQLRDGEPVKTGRHCPLAVEDDEIW